MKKKLLSISLATALTLLLTACSENKNAPVSENKTENTTVSETNETRTIQHFLGESEVPANPEKVIVLSHVSWEGTLVSLNHTPHAVMAYDGEFAPHLVEKLAETEAIPYADELDPEQILALDPDLVIMSERYEPIYNALSEAIPTVVVEVGGDWKEDHLLIADAIGKKEEGQKVIDELDQKAKDTATLLKDKLGDQKVMAVSINKKDIRVYGTKNHAVNSLLFDDMGLTPADGLPEDFGVNISLEGLSTFNPDVIFDVTYFNSGEYFDSVVNSDVWNSLNAVKEGKVFTLSTTWGFWDPIEREKGMEEIARYLNNL
ncbi:ABC transporter substrate-binding protein [Mangrovibacillus cuniculi]|uniref:ABC transporter substrate-binding protein n=1 Tax=Mangrovibacillus cuniculi TaxID=2593652 RepID=A0A7S8CDV0_9BACI|nr:ABC transporter substrate-binding protein [Mangrovibacillus cuniculi]QPC48136.1 ABC transporter substrate-binding protein [Mangrovibacillus cuniculi]